MANDDEGTAHTTAEGTQTTVNETGLAVSGNGDHSEEQGGAESVEEGKGKDPKVTKEEDPETGEIAYHAEVGASHANDKADHEAIDFARDVLTASSGIPRVKKAWRDRHMKLLIVGAPGLGKTTVIRNLLGAYAQDPKLKVNEATGPKHASRFLSNPESLTTTLIVKDVHNLITFHYRVVDTPGLAYLPNGVTDILEYLKETNIRHFTTESDKARIHPLEKYVDERVDAVLYFLPPHRLVQEDVDNIVKIAELAPVVPVLAKADSHTTDELKTYRSTVRKALDKASKGSGRRLTATFSKESLAEARAHPEAPPFVVIASPDNDLSVGKFWPVRRYPWGTCEAFSSSHSDLASLKRLLFEVAFEDLKADTERRYYAFRADHMHNVDPDMPVKQGTIVEHFIRAVVSPDSGEAKRLRHTLRTAGKVGLVVLAATLLRSYSRGGKAAVDKDLAKLQVVSKEALGTVAEKTVEVAQTAAQKAEEASHVIAVKAQEGAETVVGATKEHAPIVAKHGRRFGFLARKKVEEATSVVGDKAGVAGEVVKGKTLEAHGTVKKTLANRFGHKMSAADEARLRAEAEEAEREAAEAERKAHRWGPFGIFRK